MWDLIVSVPDHCLSFYFAWCYMCCSFHYISLYHIKMRIPGKSVSLIINFIANFRFSFQLYEICFIDRSKTLNLLSYLVYFASYRMLTTVTPCKMLNIKKSIFT